MARLFATAKALFYPTPLRVSDLIAEGLERVQPADWREPVKVRVPGASYWDSTYKDVAKEYSLLDPCAGTGEPAGRLARRLGCATTGVELDASRAAVAAGYLDTVHHASWFQCRAPVAANTYDAPKVGAQSFSVVFCNPPYDADVAADVSGARQETAFLQHLAEQLDVRKSLVVFVPPRSLLANAAFRRHVTTQWDVLGVFDFPEPERDKFKQIVMFLQHPDGQRRAVTQEWGYIAEARTKRLLGLSVLPSLEDWWGAPSSVLDSGARSRLALQPTVREDDDDKLPQLVVQPYDPTTGLADYDAREGAYATQRWRGTLDYSPTTQRPLVLPRPGHRAMLLAAGVIDGADVGGKVVKGYSQKKMVEVEHADPEKVVDRERVVSTLVTLDPATGELDSWTGDDTDKMRAWFEAHGGELADAINVQQTPLFRRTPRSWETFLGSLGAPGKLPGHDKVGLLPIQQQSVAAVVHGWTRGKSGIVLAGEMGVGKLLWDREKVLTPTGWVEMGSIQPGDFVVGRDGRPTEVVGVYPQGVVDLVVVRFNDGTEVVSSWCHLWTVQHVRNGHRNPDKWETCTLRQLHERGLADSNGNATWRVPMVAPVEYTSPKDTAIDPYWLGVVLGDGYIDPKGNARITTDREVLMALGFDAARVHAHKTAENVGTVSTAAGKDWLNAYNLAGKRAWEKQIPAHCMVQPVAFRLALLQGLLDTDGSPIASGGVEFTSTSKALVEQVAELAQSLGGVARTSTPRKTTYTYKGDELVGRESWRVNIKLPAGVVPFRLARKLDKWVAPTKYPPTRIIQSVRPFGRDTGTCIKVAAPDGLFVTRGHIVTHNTTIGVSSILLAQQVRHGGRPVKAVVMCPSHLTHKWAREADAIARKPGTAMLGDSLAAVDAFFAGDATFLVVSKETAKLGPRWRPAVTWRRAEAARNLIGDDARVAGDTNEQDGIMVACCPTCGGVARDVDGQIITQADIEKRFRAHRSNTRCRVLRPAPLPDKPDRRVPCGEPLVQVAPLTASSTRVRWPLARYMRERYARRYYLIVDEVHGMAAEDSDQSYAMQDLASGAKRVLAMTGTFYGGRASSIFHLLYKACGDFRARYRRGEFELFCRQFGLLEYVRKVDEDRRYSSSAYGYARAAAGRAKEIPGMDPAMVPLILPYTIFVKLADLQLELPPYQEEVLLVPLRGDIHAALKEMESRVASLLRTNPEVLSAFLQACLGYPDCPTQGEEIYAVDKETGDRSMVASAPSLPAEGLAKDAALVDLAVAECAAGRRVLVYCTQNNRRDARPRLRAALEGAGLRVDVLDNNVAPTAREAWVTAAVKAGVQVVLTNGKLVETGLDLLAFPTIVQFGVEYSVHTLRQSVRRSWRLGQTEPVRVVFMGYTGCMQEGALRLIAKKMRAAELIDGDEGGGLAQHDEGGNNLLLELAQAAIMGDYT